MKRKICLLLFLSAAFFSLNFASPVKAQLAKASSKIELTPVDLSEYGLQISMPAKGTPLMTTSPTTPIASEIKSDKGNTMVVLHVHQSRGKPPKTGNKIAARSTMNAIKAEAKKKKSKYKQLSSKKIKVGDSRKPWRIISKVTDKKGKKTYRVVIVWMYAYKKPRRYFHHILEVRSTLKSKKKVLAIAKAVAKSVEKKDFVSPWDKAIPKYHFSRTVTKLGFSYEMPAGWFLHNKMSNATTVSRIFAIRNYHSNITPVVTMESYMVKGASPDMHNKKYVSEYKKDFLKSLPDKKSKFISIDKIELADQPALVVAAEMKFRGKKYYIKQMHCISDGFAVTLVVKYPVEGKAGADAMMKDFIKNFDFTSEMF